MDTKKDRLRAAFLRGEVLTPLIALKSYDCMSLSQRCGEFIKEGLPIVSEKVVGKPYHRYYIPQAQIALAA